jgi:hypothetical protein
MGGITIVDVMRALQVEPTKRVTWLVGPRVRDRWSDIHGGPPPKALRQKTAGAGTHCFAVYPVAFRPEIEAIIRAHGTEAARQLGFDL